MRGDPGHFVDGGWVTALRREVEANPGALQKALAAATLNEISSVFDDLVSLTPRQRKVATALLVVASCVDSAVDAWLEADIVDFAISILHGEWGITTNDAGDALQEAPTLSGESSFELAGIPISFEVQQSVAFFQGAEADVVRSVSMPVALANARGGYIARLQLQLVNSQSIGLAPDVSSMAFLKTDREFKSAMCRVLAWAREQKVLSPGVAVRWKLAARSGEHPELRDIEGGSLSGALAVGLRCLSDDTAPPFLQDWVVTGAVDRTGQLTSVDQYQAKITAAFAGGLAVVVPRDDLSRVEATSLLNTQGKLVGAEDVERAHDIVVHRRNVYDEHGFELSAKLVSRRTVLHGVGAGLTSVGLNGLRPITDASPTELSASIKRLAEYTASHERWYWEADPEDLLQQVSALIPSIKRKLAQHSGIGRDLLLQTGARAALLAGRIAFFDLRAPVDASRYLRLALSLAEEAAQPELLAIVLGHCSFVPGWDGDPHAQHLLERAHNHARKASTTTQSWLFAIESEIAGMLSGTDERPLYALDQGARILNSSTVGPPDWIDFFDATRLEGFRASALLRSGHPAEAKKLFIAVRNELPDSAEKQKIVTLAHEAEAAIHLGEFEEACELLRLAYQVLLRAPYATGQERIEQAIELLRKHDEALVHNLLGDHQLDGDQSAN